MCLVGGGLHHGGDEVPVRKKRGITESGVQG